MSIHTMSHDDFASFSNVTDVAFEQLLRYVIGESHERIGTDQVARALFYFLSRVSNTWLSIRTLRHHSPNNEVFVVDAGTLLRTMFDAYLQAEYITAEKKEGTERAQDYFDFEHVDRFRWQSKVLTYDNLLTRRVRSSQTFADVSEAVQKAYDGVKDRFFLKNQKGNGRTRQYWYPGKPFDLAKSLGKLDEYDTLLAALHGCVHSSASALKVSGWLPIPSANEVIMWATSIAARVAHLNVDHNGIELCDLHSRILDLCRRPYLALQSPDNSQQAEDRIGGR